MNEWNEYQKKYNKTKLKQIVLKFHKENEKDLIEKVEEAKNKSKYIKDLIRNDMELKQLTMNAGIANMNDFVKIAVLEKLQKEGR